MKEQEHESNLIEIDRDEYIITLLGLRTYWQQVLDQAQSQAIEAHSTLNKLDANLAMLDQVECYGLIPRFYRTEDGNIYMMMEEKGKSMGFLP